MFTREESKKIREAFWIEFGKTYKRKWILYNTKIKEIQLKFTFDTNVAQVSLDVTANDELIRAYYYERLLALKNIILSEYLPDAIFEENYVLAEGKVVSRIYVELQKVNIHSNKDWENVMIFLEDRMNSFEMFFLEYKDYVDQ